MAADGGTVFTANCAACHAGGGNVLQAGATLSQGDLERNGMLDVEAIYKIVYSGKGKMYGFGEGCAPRGRCTFGKRLPDADITVVAEFVHSQAKAGWR
jgi:cytochrome c6